MKDRLVFDVTDANTIAESDSVGAYIRSSDGTLIDHQSVNSEEWLNVAALLYDDAGAPITDANPLAVSVKDGVNVEVDLSHTDDSVALGDGTNLLTSTTVGGDIGLDVNIINTSVSIDDGGGSITVDGTVAITGDVNVTQGTSPWVIGDGGGSITVDAVDLDIRPLLASTDSIASWLSDGAGTALTSTLVGSDQALDVNVVGFTADPSLANTAIANAAETLDVANTAQNIIVSPLSDRKYVYVYNNDNRQMFIGASGVTTANGFPVSPSSYLELRAGASVDIEFVSPKVNHEIRTMELS